MSVLALLTVLTGFAKTFIIPMAKQEFHAPLIIHIHGAFAFSWVLLFLTQTTLIHFRKYSIHSILGFAGIFIAAGVMITMVPAGMFQVKRDFDQGAGDIAYSALTGVITSGLIFFSLVLAGILNRKNPGAHKRLMLLATIVVLWPAWFRFRHYFPGVPRPDIWFGYVLADSLIIISWIWDKVRNGKIHPVLLFVGSFIIIEQGMEILAFDSAVWQNTGKWLFEVLS